MSLDQNGGKLFFWSDVIGHGFKIVMKVACVCSISRY